MSHTNYIHVALNELREWLVKFRDCLKQNLKRFGLASGTEEPLEAKIEDCLAACAGANRANAGRTDRLGRREKAEGGNCCRVRLCQQVSAMQRGRNRQRPPVARTAHPRYGTCARACSGYLSPGRRHPPRHTATVRRLPRCPDRLSAWNLTLKRSGNPSGLCAVVSGLWRGGIRRPWT
jgi:hypothetical protein